MQTRYRLFIAVGVFIVILGVIFLVRVTDISATGHNDEKVFVVKSFDSDDVPDVYLGITVQKLSDDLAEYFKVKADEGLLVLEIEEDSPADKAGLKSGDVVTAIEGRKIQKVDDIYEVLRELEEGDKVGVDYIRHGQKENVTVAVEDRSPEANFFGFCRPLGPHFMPFDHEGFREHMHDFKLKMKRFKDDFSEEMKDKRMDHPELFRWKDDDEMESFREEMEKLKDEMKELKENLKKELKDTEI